MSLFSGKPKAAPTKADALAQFRAALNAALARADQARCYPADIIHELEKRLAAREAALPSAYVGPRVTRIG